MNKESKLLSSEARLQHLTSDSLFNSSKWGGPMSMTEDGINYVADRFRLLYSDGFDARVLCYSPAGSIAKYVRELASVSHIPAGELINRLDLSTKDDGEIVSRLTTALGYGLNLVTNPENRTSPEIYFGMADWHAKSLTKLSEDILAYKQKFLRLGFTDPDRWTIRDRIEYLVENQYFSFVMQAEMLCQAQQNAIAAFVGSISNPAIEKQPYARKQRHEK